MDNTANVKDSWQPTPTRPVALRPLQPKWVNRRDRPFQINQSINQSIDGRQQGGIVLPIRQSIDQALSTDRRSVMMWICLFNYLKIVGDMN